MGFPFGHLGLHTLKVSASVISSKVLSASGSRQLQIDALVHDGNSGGPLVQVRTGQVVGVILARFNPVGGTGVSVMVAGIQPVGTDSTISYAAGISYGIALMKSEGLNV